MPKPASGLSSLLRIRPVDAILFDFRAFECIRWKCTKRQLKFAGLNTEMPTVKFQLRCCCRTKQLALSSFRSLRLVKFSNLQESN